MSMDSASQRTSLSVFLGYFSCSSSDASAESRSPSQGTKIEMYASPSPLKHSQRYQKLSPALAATPHLFTPPVPLGNSLTPGLSPIDHSPRPPRPARTLACHSPSRSFFDKLLDAQDGSDSDDVSFADDCDESSPPSPSVHLGCTSTPLRGTSQPSLSPFSSPLSSSSLDIPLSCTPASRRRSSPAYICKEQAPSTPPSTVTQKRPTSTRPPIRRAKVHKRLRVTTPGPSPTHSRVSSQRTFPPSVSINSEFPAFYIRFPVIPPVLKAPSGCTLNPPRDVFDLYTPRLVRGSGHTKVGLCPLCACTGMGKVWLSTKFSAYNYHMQYFHGVAASTARPFSPPTAFRDTPRQRPGKLERTHILEGRCHRCSRWVPVQGVKDADAKVKELFWWKHAATCHGTSTIPGERNIFISDPID
ncbi:protein of unknown function (DUF4451) domain containing protein [Lactarius tabidus]